MRWMRGLLKSSRRRRKRTSATNAAGPPRKRGRGSRRDGRRCLPNVLTDQNFDEDIIRGLAARIVGFDWRPVRAFGSGRAADPEVLDLALRESRVLLTHDAKTIYPLVYQLRAQLRPVPRVIIVAQSMAVRGAIDEIEVVLLAATDADWERNPFRLPL